MPDHLLLGLGVLALGQTGELLRIYRASKPPLLGEFALPFAMALLLPAPVVRFPGPELAGMVRPGLATGERFGDRQHWGLGLTIDLSPVPYSNDEDRQLLIFDACDDPIVSNAILPELSQLGTLQSLTQTARIVQHGETPMQERKNAPCNRRIEFIEILLSKRRQFNLPCHNAS
jgi:hypothetical protein